MLYLPLPHIKASGHVPCLLGKTALSLLLLLYTALSIFGNNGFAQHLTALSSSLPFAQSMPQRAPTPPAEVVPSLELRRLNASAFTLRDQSVANAADLAERQGNRVTSLGRGLATSTVDTVLQNHVVPRDRLQQQAGEGQRKKRKDKERDRSKRRESKRDRGRSNVREKRTSKEGEKARRPEVGKEGKRDVKREGKKTREPSRKETTKGKDRTKDKKEEKAKKAKDEKGRKRSKPRKTTVTKTKKGKKVPKQALPTIPAAVPPPTAPPAPPTKEMKVKPPVVPVTPRPPAAEKPVEPRPGLAKVDKDLLKPGMPTIPTIAFVGKRVKKAPPSRLQQDLDALCTKHFRTLCRAQEGQSPFCQATTAVARLSAEEDSVDGKAEWRCYEGSVADTDEMGMRCVDECGGQIRCTGRLRKKHTVSEPLTELSKFVDRRKWIYCSSFQYAANALCNFKKAGNVARYDPHRARWMCLDPVDIALDSTGYCADNCGGTIACAGGVIPGETPARTVYIVHNDNIVEAFAALQPCKGPDEVCVATVLNPPKCVASGSPGAILKLSHQQAAMNKLCQREVDTLCRLGKWNKHCFEPWLARKNGTGLACYPREALNFNELSRCFDGCNEAPCPGNPVSSTVPQVALPGLAEIARNPFYCSPFQAAGNKYCQTHRGAGYVARQHNVTREWQCFRNVGHVKLIRNNCRGEECFVFTRLAT